MQWPTAFKQLLPPGFDKVLGQVARGQAIRIGQVLVDAGWYSSAGNYKVVAPWKVGVMAVGFGDIVWRYLERPTAMGAGVSQTNGRMS